ncbi:MAG: DUF1801 domain-containing protein [Saprospiraceae bacterium]
MAELKTKRNKQSVEAFLNTVEDEQKKADCFELVKIMEQITGAKAEMWGDSIVGFGSYRYKYESGREGDWFLAGFSPRKQNLTMYIMGGGMRHNPELMEQLGKYKTGKACLYVKKLSDIDLTILKKLIQQSIEVLKSNS